MAQHSVVGHLGRPIEVGAGLTALIGLLRRE